jgi:hypothetical protein
VEDPCELGGMAPRSAIQTDAPAARRAGERARGALVARRRCSWRGRIWSSSSRTGFPILARAVPAAVRNVGNLIGRASGATHHRLLAISRVFHSVKSFTLTGCPTCYIRRTYYGELLGAVRDRHSLPAVPPMSGAFRARRASPTGWVGTATELSAWEHAAP